MIVNCEYCNKEFEKKARSSLERFCSAKCQHKQWCDDNRDRIRELWRASYYRNKEEKLAKVREYSKANPEVHKRAYAKFMQTERGKLQGREKAKAYRARKLGAEGCHTLMEFQKLCDKHGNVCAACGCSGSLTEDHIIPLSKGGSDEISNIQPLCHSCNSGKRDKVIDYIGAL